MATIEKRMIQKIDSIGTAINRWVAGSLAAVVAFLLVFWTFLITAGLTGRAFLGWSWLFLEEYTAYFMLASGCLGFAYAARVGAHVRVTVAVMRLPKRARLVLECIVLAVCVWWAVMLTQKINGWFLQAAASGAASLETGTPQWIPYLILVIGCASLVLAALVLFLHAVHVVIQAGHQERTGDRGNDGAES